MNVGIITSPLSGGHAARGTGTYTRELIAALKEHTELTIVPLTAPVSGLDLIHYPFFDPFFLTLPLFTHTPRVVTVHDLIPIVYKEHFPRGIQGEIKWQIQKRSLQRSSAVITDSLASKHDIVAELKFPSEKVHVVYLAPGKEFYPRSETEQRQIRRKYNLPAKFLLYVGDVNWNKNVPRLIDAMRLLDLPLMLVGKAFFNTTIPEVLEIDKQIDRVGGEKKARKLGFVPAEDLPVLYSAATLLVHVSIAEGFGLPILEAMACGTPAVVSSKSSTAEIAGPAVLVDPWDAESIAKGITQALQTRWDSQQLTRWAGKFTWEAVAASTITVYNNVL